MTTPVGRQIELARRDIARKALLDGTPLGHRTVIAEIIVGELLDRIGDAIARAETTSVETWLEQTFSRYGALPYLSSILESTCLGLMEVGRAEGWPDSDAAIRPVAQAVGRAIHRPRVAPAEISGAAIDEIDVLINNLMSRLLEKDVITGEHSRAVSLWCLRLARKLGLSSHETVLVQRGGLLHDIGKISTPNEILNAPRGLTPQEREVIERHPGQGVELMVDMPQLAALTPMVRSHHERLDGRGYPDGLEASEIPLCVRIVTVADCFNAMIGRRPYRPPLAPSVALEELRRHMGIHFDPELVEAMAHVVRDRGERM